VSVGRGLALPTAGTEIVLAQRIQRTFMRYTQRGEKKGEEGERARLRKIPNTKDNLRGSRTTQRKKGVSCEEKVKLFSTRVRQEI